jgi:hypothetical protein
VWDYRYTHSNPDLARTEIWRCDCLFCGTRLLRAREDLPFEYRNLEKGRRIIRACSVCGWWTAGAELTDESKLTRRYANVSILKGLSVSPTRLAIEETKNFLMRDPDERFGVSPKLFEEVVASVYQDFGYEVRVTGRRSDGGIDVILDGPGDVLVGVQVKRWKSKIQAEEIRSLAGALILQGMTKGVFITTSDFTTGARSTASAYHGRGIAVELSNWEEFYDALEISRIVGMQNIFDEWHPAALVPLVQLQEIRGGTFSRNRESIYNESYLEFMKMYREDKAFQEEVDSMYPG